MPCAHTPPCLGQYPWKKSKSASAHTPCVLAFSYGYNPSNYEGGAYVRWEAKKRGVRTQAKAISGLFIPR